MLDSVAVLLRLCIWFIDVMLFLVLYNNNNSDVIINLAGLINSSLCSEVESILSRWVHLEGSQTLGRLQVDSRLIFGWVATKEKMVDGVQLEYVGE